MSYNITTIKIILTTANNFSFLYFHIKVLSGELVIVLGPGCRIVSAKSRKSNQQECRNINREITKEIIWKGGYGKHFQKCLVSINTEITPIITPCLSFSFSCWRFWPTGQDDSLDGVRGHPWGICLYQNQILFSCNVKK